MKTNKENDHKLIDNHINGTLSEHEEKTFQERLSNDSAFADEVKWIKTLSQDLQQLPTNTIQEILAKDISYIQTKNQLIRLNAEIEQEESAVEVTASKTNKNKVAEMKWVAAASVTIAILGIGYWLSTIDSVKDRISDLLRTDGQHITINNDSDSTAVSMNAQDSVKIKIQERALAYLSDKPKVANPPASIEPVIKAYQNDDPERALRLLANVNNPVRPVDNSSIVDSSSTPRYGAGTDPVKSATVDSAESKRLRNYKQFYTGLIYIEQGRFREASTTFNEVSIPLHRQAEWYQAICLLQLKQIDKGKAILQRIKQQPSHPYYTQAQELWKQF